MNAQEQVATSAQAPVYQSSQLAEPARRIWDFQARVCIAGPLSDEEFQRLISQHLRATQHITERRQEPGIAEDVLPEDWRRAS